MKVPNNSISDSIQQETKDWYKDYYRKKGKDRNDWTNPEVLFTLLAFEASIISTLRKIQEIDRNESLILDVGCGGGVSRSFYN